VVEDTKPDGITTSEFVADSQAQLNAHLVPDMAKACAEIILRVNGSQLAHLISRDPRDCWENLRGVHRTCGFATSLTICCKFLIAKSSTSQSMQTWIAFVRLQVHAMELPDIKALIKMSF
jgi:hypothetical protein